MCTKRVLRNQFVWLQFKGALLHVKFNLKTSEQTGLRCTRYDITSFLLAVVNIIDNTTIFAAPTLLQLQILLWAKIAESL